MLCHATHIRRNTGATVGLSWVTVRERKHCVFHMNGVSCGRTLTTNIFYYNVLFFHCNHLQFAVIFFSFSGIPLSFKTTRAQFRLTERQLTPLISWSDAYVRFNKASAFQVFCNMSRKIKQSCHIPLSENSTQALSEQARCRDDFESVVWGLTLL